MKSAIFTAFIAAATLGACGSDGTTTSRRGPGGAIGSYQNPPANPQTALLSPQQPLPNATAPLPNDQSPLPNPDQPVSSGGAGAPSDTCNSICEGTGNCFAGCQQRCGDLGMILGRCAAPIASFVQCAQSVGIDIVCNGNGEINVSDRTCRAEARAAADCLNLIVQPPDNSGPGNPPNARRRNDAGMPMP